MTDTTETTDPAPEPEPEAPRDEAREALVDAFRHHLGDGVVEAVVASSDIWIRVTPEAWGRVAEVAKNHLGLDYFCYLSAIDWLPNPTMGGKQVWDLEGQGPADEEGESALETGVAGGDTRFQLLARLYSTTSHLGVTFKADLPDGDLRAPSWIEIYRGADWHERETWEMFGISFDGHPGLRHLYLPMEFEGFPLRKDFPLLSREVKPWPGLVDKEPIPGEGDEESSEEAAE